MGEKFIINGNKELCGEVEIRGSKNAAATIIASCLLTKEKCVISNLPIVEDIKNLLDILKEMGAEIDTSNLESKRTISIQAENIDTKKIDFSKFSKARTSVLLIGPLLTRFDEFSISKPGGDKIGLRPISSHLRAFKQLGVEVKENGDFYIFYRKELNGAEIVLPEFSVTATENLLMASCLARGNTIIRTAAVEPHVMDLIKMLNKMGGDITSIAPHVFLIKGKSRLKGVEHNIIGDYIEAGTFLLAGIATKGRVKVKNIEIQDLSFFLEKLKEIGANIKINKQERSVEVSRKNGLKATRIQALPFPGFPTDLLPLIVPLLVMANGKSLIHDPLYENRLNYVQELRKMGADIEIVDPHRAFILGPSELFGVSIESWDIRAGASLIIAGLVAKGTTTINNIYQIDRGYEKIEQRLKKIGADIKRVKE